MKWTAANRSIDNQDVVVWYTTGDHPQSAAGGLAGDAGGVDRIPAGAVGVFFAESGAVRAGSVQ